MNEEKIKKFSQSGISAEEAVKNVIDGSDIRINEDKTYGAKIGEKEIKVKFRPAAELKWKFRDISEYYGKFSYEYVYAAEDAIDHIKSVEEQFEEEYTGNIGEDEFLEFCVPKLRYEEMEKLSKSLCIDRFACFVKICNICAEDDVLQHIAELAAKKKDGSLISRRIMPITAYMAVNKDLQMIELVARNVSGTEIEIVIREQLVDRNELEKVSENPVLDCIVEKLTGKESVKRRVANRSIKIKGTPLQGRKTSVTVEAIETENGELALNVDPAVPLSSFKCLKGSDEKGYEYIVGDINFDKYVEVGERQYHIWTWEGVLQRSFSFGWDAIVFLKKMYTHKGGFKDNYIYLRDKLKSEGLSDKEKEEVFKKKYLTGAAINEFAYELFTYTDMLMDYLENLDCEQLIREYPRAKNSPNCLKLIDQNFSLIDIISRGKYIHIKNADLCEYFNNEDFGFRKKPMIVPFVKWRGTTELGVWFIGAYLEFILEWEK